MLPGTVCKIPVHGPIILVYHSVACSLISLLITERTKLKTKSRFRTWFAMSVMFCPGWKIINLGSDFRVLLFSYMEVLRFWTITRKSICSSHIALIGQSVVLLVSNLGEIILQEYVVVLVGHGKEKSQAVKNLEAFLGSDSESFVSWYVFLILISLDEFSLFLLSCCHVLLDDS